MVRPKSCKNKVFGHYGVVYDKQGAVSDYVFKDGETIVDFAAGSLERNLGTLIVSATINYGVEAVQVEYGPMLKSESSQEYLSEFIKQEVLRSQGASREIIEIVKTHGDYTGSGERIVRFFEKLAGKKEYAPRMKEVSGVSYDIANLSYEDLPDVFKAENFESAVVAERALLDGISKRLQDDELIERASDQIHEAWLSRNGS